MCNCKTTPLSRYQRRLSGPLIDRIDLVCQLEPTRPLELVADSSENEGSAAVRERVAAARERQRRRLAGTAALCNASMDAAPHSALRSSRRSLAGAHARGARGCRDERSGTRSGAETRAHDRRSRWSRAGKRGRHRRGGRLPHVERVEGRGMSGATCCDGCLRRGALVGLIARPLAGLVDPGAARQRCWR